MIAGRPSEMYHALSSMLGLDQVTATERRLNDARKRLETEAGAGVTVSEPPRRAIQKGSCPIRPWASG